MRCGRVGLTSPVVEAELCGIVCEVLSALGFSDFYLRLNHRILLTEVLNAAGVAEALHGTALVALDKLDKIKMEGVANEMRERGISQQSVDALTSVFEGGVALGMLTNGPMASVQSVADFVSGAEPDPPSVENLRLISSTRTRRPRRDASCSLRVWRAGCRTTRARSWK